jgi:hypothetical protein
VGIKLERKKNMENMTGPYFLYDKKIAVLNGGIQVNVRFRSVQQKLTSGTFTWALNPPID